MRIGSDRRYEFDVGPDAFWAAASSTESFRSWWPWLSKFDAGPLAAGEIWRCSVQPPLPYSVGFSLELYDVTPGELVRARVSGDIDGHARLDIEPDAYGCRVRLRSSLAPSNRMLRTIATVAWPVATFGHNWVLDTGARQFRDRAFTGTERSA